MQPAAAATMEISVVAPRKDERSATQSGWPALRHALRRLRPTAETMFAQPRSSLLYSQQAEMENNLDVHQLMDK